MHGAQGARRSVWSAHRRGVVQLLVDLHLSGLLGGRSAVVALGQLPQSKRLARLAAVTATGAVPCTREEGET